jgi:hypothetical protein
MKDLRTAEKITRDFVEQLVELANKSCKLFDEYREELDLSEDDMEAAMDVVREVMDGSRSDVEEITKDLTDVICLDDPTEDMDKE